LKTEYAISHIAPKYVLETINKNMIKKAIDRSFEKVELCVMDWKGMKSHHRETLLQILEELHLPFTKVRKLLRA